MSTDVHSLITLYRGKNYALTRQWITWHVIAHDLHHGGELTLMLGMQGIALPSWATKAAISPNALPWPSHPNQPRRGGLTLCSLSTAVERAGVRPPSPVNCILVLQRGQIPLIEHHQPGNAAHQARDHQDPGVPPGQLMEDKRIYSRGVVKRAGLE